MLRAPVLLRGLLATLSVVWLAGCTNLFFVPLRQQVYTPEQLGIRPVDTWLRAADGTRLFAWQLPATGPTRGVVCYFHGNAENISTHVASVSWLPEAGYEVLAVDYRGYGASAGTPEFPEVFQDVRAGLDWCLERAEALGVRAYALGQSLGAALVLDSVARDPYRQRFAGVIADSGFSSYRRIARDALGASWLFWPFQYPLSWLVTRDHAPERAVAHLAPLPLLLMHSTDDRIVPYAHALRIRAAARGPRCFLATGGPHNAAFRFEENRQALLAFLAAPWAPAGLDCETGPATDLPPEAQPAP